MGRKGREADGQQQAEDEATQSEQGWVARWICRLCQGTFILRGRHVIPFAKKTVVGASGLKTRLFDNGINGVLGILLHQVDGVVQLELVEPIVQIATRLLTEEAH